MPSEIVSVLSFESYYQQQQQKIGSKMISSSVEKNKNHSKIKGMVNVCQTSWADGNQLSTS